MRVQETGGDGERATSRNFPNGQAEITGRNGTPPADPVQRTLTHGKGKKEGGRGSRSKQSKP